MILAADSPGGSPQLSFRCAEQMVCTAITAVTYHPSPHAATQRNVCMHTCHSMRAVCTASHPRLLCLVICLFGISIRHGNARQTQQSGGASDSECCCGIGDGKPLSFDCHVNPNDQSKMMGGQRLTTLSLTPVLPAILLEDTDEGIHRGPLDAG